MQPGRAAKLHSADPGAALGPKQGIWAPVLAQAGPKRSLDDAEEAAHPTSQHGWVRSAKGSQDEVFQSQGTKSKKNGRTEKNGKQEKLEHVVKQLNHTQ